ncbi:MBOAT family O-acyltransferase [Terasakiella pusilla]|uniref:MBOAT family O-acyltransferase n=1 Tax=Terasakiella pusilla TaxID=64973 RepID=UPI003AA803CA
MLFQLPSFILFFVVFASGLRAIPDAFKKQYALVASIIFYSFWYVPYTFVLLGLILFGWLSCQLLSRSGGRLSLLVILSLLPLCYYKYTGFLLSIIGVDEQGFHLMLPLGISFVTFTLISMMIDQVRSKSPPASLLDVGLFISFFPQLIAGPILRTQQMMPQLDFLQVKGRQIIYNLPLFAVGIFKKVLIADPIARYIDPVFSNPAQYNVLDLAVAMFGFSIQIYCDFSAYSDMAIASAAMLGIKLPENFRSPYSAHSMNEIWRRWHMTLSLWIRDYLFFPLTRRLKTKLIYLSFLISMTLSGLWHGANATFILWGAVHGMLLIIEHGLGYERWISRTRLRRASGVMFNFLLWSLVIVLFRSPDLLTAFDFYQGFWQNGLGEFHDDHMLIVGLIAMTLLFHKFDQVDRIRQLFVRVSPIISVSISVGLIMGCSILAASQPQNFYYFEF